MPRPPSATPTLTTLAQQLTPRERRALRRVERQHGPLGLAIPETDDRPAHAWHGPVERRDPRAYQRQATIGIVRCQTCGHWRDESPHMRCSTCGAFHPLPSQD